MWAIVLYLSILDISIDRFIKIYIYTNTRLYSVRQTATGFFLNTTSVIPDDSAVADGPESDSSVWLRSGLLWEGWSWGRFAGLDPHVNSTAVFTPKVVSLFDSRYLGEVVRTSD